MERERKSERHPHTRPDDLAHGVEAPLQGSGERKPGFPGLIYIYIVRAVTALTGPSQCRERERERVRERERETVRFVIEREREKERERERDRERERQ